jgi:hypothetical protein
VPQPVLEVLFVGTAVLLSVELRLHEAPRRVVHRQRLVVHPAALEHVARRHPGAARGVSLLPYAGACCLPGSCWRPSVPVLTVAPRACRSEHATWRRHRIRCRCRGMGGAILSALRSGLKKSDKLGARTDEAGAGA